VYAMPINDRFRTGGHRAPRSRAAFSAQRNSADRRSVPVLWSIVIHLFGYLGHCIGLSKPASRSSMKLLLKNLRADIAAGLLLLLPLSLTLFILYRLWGAIHAPVRLAAARLGLEGVLKVNGLLLVSALVMLVIVLLVGRLVRARGKGGLQAWAEKRLLSHIPGYMYARVIMEARLGISEPALVRPALLRTGDGWQPVFQVETMADGRSVWCICQALLSVRADQFCWWRAVMFRCSPAPWSGWIPPCAAMAAGSVSCFRPHRCSPEARYQCPEPSSRMNRVIPAPLRRM
jgi:hypothetical protein